MDKWWQKPLRAVTLEFPASNVAMIDVKSIIDETFHGAVNTLNVFTTGYYPGGTAFYQSKIAPHYPGLGKRDLLTESIEAGHANGQKIVAYIASIWGNRDLYEKHPDWAQRKNDGRVTSWDDELTSVAFCPNTPYRDYLASIVQEVIDHYDIDGFYFDEPSFQSWCNCESCQKKFYQEFHQSLPVKENWEDPAFQNFIEWRYRQISNWRQSLADLARSESRCVLFQGAFPLAFLNNDLIKFSGIQFYNPYTERFGVGWHVPTAHAADLAHSAQAGDVVHFELYRRSVDEPLWWYGVSLRYGQSIAKKKQIMVLNMMAQSPFDLYGLPEAELRLSVAETIANSGSPLFARYYPDRVDQKAWDRVYACLHDSRQLEPYLHPRLSIKYAAILFSQSTLDRFDHQLEKASHLGCLKGFAKALLQEQVLFDVITEQDLEQELNEYKVLILPNASCLSEKSKEIIWQYFIRGGGIVGSYETGLFDSHGYQDDQNLSTLFGVSYGSKMNPWHGFDVYMRMHHNELGVDDTADKLIPTGGIQVPVVSNGAQVVAEVLGGSTVHYGPLGEEAGEPSILAFAPEGKGRSVYFALPVGNRYLEFGVEDHRKLIVGAVKWAARENPPIHLEGAPKTLAVTAYEQPETSRIVIHLVDSIQDEIIKPIIELPVHRDVRIMSKVKSQPKNVEIFGVSQKPAWKWDAGVIALQIPPFRCSATVVITM